MHKSNQKKTKQNKIIESSSNISKVVKKQRLALEAFISCWLTFAGDEFNGARKGEVVGKVSCQVPPPAPLHNMAFLGSGEEQLVGSSNPQVCFFFLFFLDVPFAQMDMEKTPHAYLTRSGMLESTHFYRLGPSCSYQHGHQTGSSNHKNTAGLEKEEKSHFQRRRQHSTLPVPLMCPVH